MKDPGAVAAVRAGALLLGAAAFRLVLSPAPASPVLAHRDDVTEGLLATGDSLALEAERRSRPLGEGEVLDPNQADEVELDRLPGIGPARAVRIVEERAAHGPYREPDDLLRVPGIGPASLERLKPFLDFSGAASLPRSGGTKGVPQERRLLGVVDQDPGPTVKAPVRLNHASAVQLETLPGIGPVLAQRIIEIRKARGGFRSLDDLLDVSGIGPAVLTRLRPLITL